MSMITKIIITDTNIVTDLNNANILSDFVVLEEVYMSDLVKYDEVNSKTGNMKIIGKFKIIEATDEELAEISSIRKDKPELFDYDCLNFIIARDHKCLLATGDNALKKYSELHGIEVIRTLKIIELMTKNNIITYEKAIKACELLKENPSTRIPINLIEDFIIKLEKQIIKV